jgi:hypothetical protein
MQEMEVENLAAPPEEQEAESPARPAARLCRASVSRVFDGALVPRHSRRAQDVADIGPKNFRIRRSLNGDTGNGAIQAQRANYGRGMPMALGSFGMDALAPLGAAAQASQIGLGA